ncbi:MAG: hypothetical protein GTN76_02540 [Candidatus Aenigmarchaeota archaeon]|nr:hypothetical protein [Candidatus Aenigmarchaeota archaeon]
MGLSEKNLQSTEELIKIVEKRVTKDIGAVIVAPGVSGELKERLASILKGRIPVITIQGTSLMDPNALARAETLYEVVNMETKTMKYFPPEALLRGLNEGIKPLLERLKLSLAPVEGIFELLSCIFPRGISVAILTGLIAIDCLGLEVTGATKNMIVVAGSTRAEGLDTALVLRPSKSRELFLRLDKAVVKEILVMPYINR